VSVGCIATEIGGLKSHLDCNIANLYIMACWKSFVSGIIFTCGFRFGGEGNFSLRFKFSKNLKLLHTECFYGNLSYVIKEAYNFLCWRIAGDLYETSINHGKSFNRQV